MPKMLYQSKRRVKSNINRTFYAFISKDEKMCKKGLKTFCMDLRVSEVKVITMFEAFLKPIEIALFSLDYNRLLT